MGDKEGREDEEEGEMKMLLHCSPVYPLPEAIKKMDHSETACRYCGVSYLIFHEFHQLRTQLAQLEAKLQELRETVQREKAQRKALQLDRLEWERALRLQVQQETEAREKHNREELEERNHVTVRALRVEFEAKFESQTSEVEKAFQKICEEKESQLRGELGHLAVEKLRSQREELERRAQEREKVVSEALQKANKNLEDLRKNFQQLEERLEITAARREDAEHALGKEKQHVETLRGTCVRQQQALQATLSFLKFSGRVLADVRGFFNQLMETWQTLRCQILQQSTQVFLALNEELQHSTVNLQKVREEKERLTQQLMKQKGQRDEQLMQQENSEKEHRITLLRLKGELEEKNQRWLLCQQRCDAMQKQLLSWEQREKQLNQEYCAAVEEVTQMQKALELIQQEKRELTAERDVLRESHSEAMAKMKEDYRQQTVKLAAALQEQRSQSAFDQKEQRAELRREAELQLENEREKNKMLLLKYRQENSQLQQKLEEKEQEVQNLHERGRMEEEKRKQDEERKRREEEMQQQEAQKLSRAKAELELMTGKNAELMEEVALLQETVRKECEEREELTAALSRAQQELFQRQSAPSNRDSSRPPPDLMKKRTPPRNNNFLTRSSTSPNTLWPSPACTDKDRGLDTDGRRAGKSSESWSSDGVFGGEKSLKGTLPRLKASNKIRSVMEKKNKP